MKTASKTSGTLKVVLPTRTETHRWDGEDGQDAAREVFELRVKEGMLASVRTSAGRLQQVRSWDEVTTFENAEVKITPAIAGG